MQQLVSTATGEVTPLFHAPIGMSSTQIAEISKKIKSAKEANQTDFTDVTPEYWEARIGEERILAFSTYKIINKKDEKTGEKVQGFAVIFHDGTREIVMAQIAIKDAMKTAIEGEVFKIKCVGGGSGKAKKFSVERYNG